MARILDTESIKGKIKTEIDKVKVNIFDEETIKKLNQAEKNIVEELDKGTGMIRIEGVSKQRFLSPLSGYCLVNDERKSWYLYHAVMQIIVMPEIQTILKERYGKRYDGMMDRLFKYSSAIELVKHYLDGCEKKTIENNDVTKVAFIRAMDILSKMPIINYELNHLFIVITLNTNLGTVSIPSSMMQAMEREHKKVRYEEERPVRENIEDMGG